RRGPDGERCLLQTLHAPRVPDRPPLHEENRRRRRAAIGDGPPRMRRAVFLDRDGTLVEEAGYLDRLERLVFFPYTVDAVRVLNRAGFAVVVITNQAGIARGIVREAFVAEAHSHIADTLAAGGARVDGFYYCPHYPDGVLEQYRKACDCRKPQPGLLRRAGTDLDLDLARSFVVGDRWHDRAAGAPGRAGGGLGSDGSRPAGRRESAPGRGAGRDRGQPHGSCGVDSSTGMKKTARPGHPVEPARLLALIDAIAGRRVVIIGDLIADEFIYGEIARV